MSMLGEQGLHRLDRAIRTLSHSLKWSNGKAPLSGGVGAKPLGEGVAIKQCVRIFVGSVGSESGP